MQKQCTGWVWYLANDFQFFLLSPPIIYAYCKNRKAGYMLAGFLIICSMLVNGIVTAVYDLSITLFAGNINGLDTLYSKPWGRMGAYFVGAIFGFGYFEFTSKVKHPELNDTYACRIFKHLQKSRVTSIIVATIGIGLTALYVFPLGPHYNQCGMAPKNCWAKAPSVLYNLTARPFFVFGLGLILIPTFVGRLRIIRNFLGSEIFAVLARLNYMVYMVHLLVIFWFLADLRQGVYLNNLNQWFFSISSTVVSFAVAIPFTLLCEVPFLNIEKYLLFPTKKKPRNDSVESMQKEVSRGMDKDLKYYPILEESDTTDSQMKKLVG